jgi:F0F1-type ATP synthase assembly protein I
MSDSNKEQTAINTRRNKSIQAVQATKSDQVSDPLDPTTSVARRKRRHFVELIALISLGAIGFIIFASRSAIAQPYEGLGIALCAVACGVLLVRHAFRVLTEQDKLEEEQVNADQATVSPSQPNSGGPQMNPTVSLPEADQNIK